MTGIFEEILAKPRRVVYHEYLKQPPTPEEMLNGVKNVLKKRIELTEVSYDSLLEPIQYISQHSDGDMNYAITWLRKIIECAERNGLDKVDMKCVREIENVLYEKKIEKGDS